MFEDLAEEEKYSIITDDDVVAGVSESDCTPYSVH